MKKYSFITTFWLVLISLPTYSQTITNTEAVEYDPTQNRFLITNGTSILQQASGSQDFDFFGEGSASFGMEVMNGTLFSISNSVEAYDLITEELLISLAIPGSGFLNGMASDPATDRIWVTDFQNNRIYEIDFSDIENPTFDAVVTNTQCTPNGITHDAANNRLVYTCWTGGNIRDVDLSNYSTSTLINTNLQNIDGIDHDHAGNFYISSWSPVNRITRLSDEFTTQETITAPGISNPADISYAVETDTLAIANSGNDSVTYINFNSATNVSEINDNPLKLNVYPNPISNHSYISFSLATNTQCSVRLYDQNGKFVKELMNEYASSGNHKILLTDVIIEKGVYLCEITSDQLHDSVYIIKNN